MDDSRFDALTRIIARPASRRRMLAGVITAALAPLTIAAKPEAAKCLAVGKRCSLPAGDKRHSHGKHNGKGGKGGKGKHHPPSCAKCCSRYGAAGADGKARCACKSEGIACDGDSQCCSGQCRNQTCTGCPPDQVFCPDGCSNLQTDKNHCGSCAHACDSGQRCVNGDCVCDGTSCPRGCCAEDGSCQRGTSDQACGIGGADCKQCGTCTSCDGTQCAATDGACCNDGAGVCHGDQCAACDRGQRCEGGQCVCDATSCPNGCCNGDQCVAVANQTDQICGKNGGACAACGSKNICVSGVCIVGQGTCPAGASFCTTGVTICNGADKCICYVSTEDETRCAYGTRLNGRGGSCGECQSSAECAAFFPGIPGVFCIKSAGTSGCCNGGAGGFCMAPCPTS